MDKEITVSPFYHSALNAVTKTHALVSTSQYFINRWMPLLGGVGTCIVLALRALGYFNQSTGECRDEIKIRKSELAKRAGVSERTLTRELGIDPKTGKLVNPSLHLFVETTRSHRRDALGRVWQEENGYRVSMDDPIHPDDWEKVAEKVAERQAQKDKTPAGHNGPPEAAPEGQNVQKPRQSVKTSGQNGRKAGQNGSPHKNDSYDLKTPKKTLPEVFASPSPRKAFDDLTATEREPWILKAEEHPAAQEAKATKSPECWAMVRGLILKPIARRMYCEAET